VSVASAASRLVRQLAYGTLWPATNLFFRLYFRMRVVGRPRPFPSGALVVAANHVSYLDPVVLGLALPRRVTFLVTSSVFDLPLYRPWMWLFGCIRVRDEQLNVEAMRAALATLERGGVVAIFPEGGLSDDGRLREGALGVASLLLQSGAPLLAAGLVGTRAALPRGGGVPRPARVEVRLAAPFDPCALEPGAVPRDARRVVRDRVMAAIAALLPDQMKPVSSSS
jgi:1-acyl-sn-glycerol-3-phosphate acyltransferase